MSPEFEEILCKRYPKIFARGTFVFEHDDGWYDLIGSLCNTIQSHIDDVTCTQVVATQIKEKFGTLRFYYAGGDDQVHGMVRMAETMSSIICEMTGKPGHLHMHGQWYKTLSPEKAKEMEFEPVPSVETV